MARGYLSMQPPIVGHNSTAIPNLLTGSDHNLFSTLQMHLTPLKSTDSDLGPTEVKNDREMHPRRRCGQAYPFKQFGMSGMVTVRHIESQ